MPPPQSSKPDPRVTWAQAIGSAVLGLLLVPIGVNLLAFPMFSWHESYHVAQGIGSWIFFLSIFAAPLGALYWICWGAIASTSEDGGNLPAAWLGFLGFLVLLTAGIGGSGILL